MSKKYSHWGKLAPAAVVIAAILVSGKGDEVLSGQETAQTQIVKASQLAIWKTQRARQVQKVRQAQKADLTKQVIRGIVLRRPVIQDRPLPLPGQQLEAEWELPIHLPQQFRQTVIGTVPIQEAAPALEDRFPYRL